VRIEVSWDNEDDIDLHLIRSQGDEFSDPGDIPNDCFYGNRTPDWGEVGDPTDNPVYLGDEETFGPETILLGHLEEDRRYLVNVQFARDRRRGDPTIELRVFSFGNVRTFTATLRENGENFAPVIIEGDGGLTETE
jgi:hypothetical protein